jgi:integrase
MSTPIPLSDHRESVLNLYRATEKKPATVSRFRQMFDELDATLGPLATTADLTTDAMVLWRGLFGRQRSPETIIGHLSVLRTICAVACEEGRLERPPAWKRLRPKRRKTHAKRHHSRAEVARLLSYLRGRVTHLGDWFSRRLQAAVAIAAYTGLRRDELLCLRLVDVDLAAGIISVVPLPARDLKTAEAERIVPIPPELRSILVAWMPFAGPEYLLPGVKRKGPWRRAKAGRRPVDELKAACVACGISIGTWQWLRRAWATHAETGWLLPDGAIERVMGHTTPKTARRWYCQTDVDNLAAIGRLITYQT